MASTNVRVGAVVLVLLVCVTGTSCDTLPSPRVLVTGASGFIGRALVDNLASQTTATPSIFVVVRSAVSVAKVLPSSVTVLEADLTDPTSLASAMAVASLDAPLDVVIHLGAVMDFYPKTDKVADLLWRVNVNGTRHLLLAAADAGARRFVYVSSTEAVGACTECSEGVEPHPHYLYGKSKLAAEALVRNSSLDHVILRPTGVFGPGDDFAMHELMTMVWSGLLFFTPGDGTSQLMFTHAEDVNQAILLSVNASPAALNNTFFICPNESLSFKEWIVLIASFVSRTVLPWLHLPFPVVKAVTSMLAPVMNHNKRRVFMYHPDTIARMGENRSYSNAKARKLLGFSPAYSAASGVEQAIAWHKEQGDFPWTPLSPVLLSTLAVGVAVWLLRRFC
eukprot:m.136837 g.136837  ORF g.136837 m.136837 type:complete len:393 (-) comp16982_c0_seq7:1478-2656(-)